MRKIYFIILTFRPSLELLRQNLKLLEKHKVIVVDNTPDMEEKETVRRTVKDSAHFIGNEKNLGYTGGMNTGMKYAWSQNADWVVLLNDDVELSKDAIHTLTSRLGGEQPSVVGPYPGYLDHKRWTTILPKYAPTEKTPDYLSGSCLAIHKDVDRRVQGFYKDYFLYYEDVDYCIQAKKFGFPLIRITIPGLVHQDGKSIDKGSFAHSYYLARNHLLFIERQAPMSVKLHEVIRLPKTLWEYRYFMNKAGSQGVMDFLFLRYGELKR